MDTIKDRICAIIEAKKMTQYRFEVLCDLSSGYIKSIGEEVGSTKIAKILRKFPDISPAWLVLGDGPMLNTQTEQSKESNENQAANGNSDSIRPLNNPKNRDLDVEDGIRQLRYEVERLKALIQAKDEEINFYRTTIASALQGRKDKE